MFHFVSDYICSRAELETKRAKRGCKKRERERGKVAKRPKNKKRKKGRREG